MCHVYVVKPFKVDEEIASNNATVSDYEDILLGVSVIEDCYTIFLHHKILNKTYVPLKSFQISLLCAFVLGSPSCYITSNPSTNRAN